MGSACRLMAEAISSSRSVSSRSWRNVAINRRCIAASTARRDSRRTEMASGCIFHKCEARYRIGQGCSLLLLSKVLVVFVVLQRPHGKSSQFHTEREENFAVVDGRMGCQIHRFQPRTRRPYGECPPAPIGRENGRRPV